MSNGSGGSNATLILVLGILSILCIPFLGPVAWIMGNNALKELDQGFGNPNDRGLVIAGRILGIIGTVLLILSVIFICIYLVIIIMISASMATQP